ncbi:hypothetical protein [Aeromicrobium sp. CTD01-1L150]|uniref:hypothetical protein n=1 Tax=Aeromicrobium sp. CTD01-1L150 TaxID=3341830 RepID=UPI0035BEC70D
MKFPRKSLAAAGAAALVMVAGAAYAGPPWTVSVGGDSTGSPASYTAETIGASPQIEFTVPGLNLGCDSGTAEGVIIPGPTSGKAGEIADTEFIDCIGPLDIDLEVTQNATWDIEITGDNVGGVTPGAITNVDASVSNPDGLCSFDVTGEVGGAFDENTQQLSVSGGGLTVSNVDQCFGLILNGDPATFDGTYQLADIDTVTIAN